MLWLSMLVPALAAAPGPTGSLRLQVVDDEMALPIPGVVVTLDCPGQVLPERELLTDTNGQLLVVELAPDLCTLTVSKAGFGSVKVVRVPISVNRVWVQAVEMSQTALTEVVVESSHQAVGTENTTRGSVLTKDLLDRVPSGRSYQQAVQMAAGVTGQGGNPNMAGGATNENVYRGGGYTEHGVHDVALTDEDRLATFAVDVDTGSYSRVRSWLQDGSLPHRAAVRVEEFVNTFSYDYAHNDDADEPLGVRLEAAPHPWNPHKVLLRAALQGLQPPERTRPPAKLTFLVDVSCSMSGPDRLALARQSLHVLVDNLGPEDQVAIATYSGGVREVLRPTFTTRKEPIHAAIDSLWPGGGTAMNDGMTLAYEMADEMYLKGAENRVIVLSDGDANIGPSTHHEVLKSLEAWAGKGITMSTIGFGTGNYQDTMMEQLANKGDGTYHYIDGDQEAERVFGIHVAGTLQTIARDAKVQLEFPPDAVLAYRQIGYENREIADSDFRDDAVDGGEVGSGHQVTALFELDLVDDPGPVLARMHVRAKPPGEDAAAREWSGALETRAVHDSFDDASSDTRLAFGIATFAEILRGSPFTEEVSWSDLQDLIGGAIRSDPHHAELVDLVGKARALDTQDRPR